MCTRGHTTPFMKQCFTTLGVDLTIICFGCVIGFPAFLIPQLFNSDSTIEISPQSASWIASASALGMLGGYSLAPLIMDRLGRKLTHCIVSVILIIGWLAIAFATDVKAIITCRILKGIAGGLLWPLSSVFLAECLSPRNRGAFLTTITLSNSVGVLLVYLLGSVLSWQTTSLVCIIFPFVSLIITICTPESPSWYYSKGKYDKFIETFRWFRGTVEEQELSSMLRSNLDKDRSDTEDSDNKNGNCFGCMKEVTKKEFYKPVIIMIHNAIMILFAGGTTLQTYFFIIVSRMIESKVDFHLWARYIIIATVLSNFLAIFAIHKFKRRFMLFFSGALCIISHVGIVFYLYANSAGWFQKSSWISIFFLSLILLSDAGGITPLKMVIAGEVFPLRYRSISVSISSAFGTIVMFIFLHLFLSLVEVLHLQGTYLLSGSIVMYNLLILWIMLPETKGRTLLQIEEGFKIKQIQQNNVVLTELNV